MKKIFSRMFGDMFKWPSRRFFNWYCIAMGALTLVATVEMVVRHVSDPGTTAGAVVGNALLSIPAMVVIGAILWVVIGLYYRIGSEIYQGLVSFVAALPGIWRGLCNAGSACISALVGFVCFIIALPRHIVSVWRRFKALDSMQKYGLFVGVSAAMLALTIGWLMWPAAVNLHGHLPDWLSDRDNFGRFTHTLMIDWFISMLVIAFVLPVYVSLAFAAGKALFKKS